jgi:hypothetical protein
MYSVAFNEKRRVYVVYRGERRIKAFSTESAAWRYIAAVWRA